MTMTPLVLGSRTIRKLPRVAIAIGKNCYQDASTLTSEEAGRKAQRLAATLPEKTLESPATLLAHAGMEKIPNAPMAPPLHVATTYTRPADGSYRDTDSKYARMDNPTRLLLEKTVFELECIGLDFSGEVEPTTFAFSSGMMAVTSIILAHKSPITVLVPKDIYHGVPSVLAQVFCRHNVTMKSVNMSCISEIAEAITNSERDSDVVVWLETPSNPLCQIVDIKAVCDMVESISSHKVTTVVDTTTASPVLTRALEFGADISMHSGTKYLAGHSDALIGLITASPTTQRGKELVSLLKSVQIDAGGVASPWDSWLTLRGMRTLHVRVERQSKTAQSVAEYLDKHELIYRVHYPGLPSHPQHEVAKKQMKRGFSGMLSFELESEVAATAFAGALEVIQRATSLGGTETLIEHRASIEPPSRVTSPGGLLRMSVGLEDPADLIRDIEKAISITEQVMSEEDVRM